MAMILFAECRSKLVIFPYGMALHIGESDFSLSPCLAKHDAKLVIVDLVVIEGRRSILVGGTKELRTRSFSSCRLGLG